MTFSKRIIKPTPPRMVENGQVTAFGHFDQPFRINNIHEADVFGLGKIGGRLLNRFRLKEWQHFAVLGPDLLLTFVVVNAHYLSNSFCYFVNRATGEKIEHSRVASPFAAKMPDDLWNGRCDFRAAGYGIEVLNRLRANRHFAKIYAAPEGDQASVSANLEFHANRQRHHPLEVVLRLAPNRPAYSHKMACPASGHIRVGEQFFELDPERHLVLIDVHKAYYPYNMTWRWASCAGFDESGRVVGINLTHNVVADDNDNNENALWVGDGLSMFQAARFDFEPTRLLEPWRIKTTDGRCNLQFKPEGERSGSIQAGVVSSDYHQPFGTFSGEAVDDEGRVHKIDNFYGVTEFHRARF